MKRTQLNFSIFINASEKKVWHKMLDKEDYKYWTQEFDLLSHYEGELELGSEIRFLGGDADNNSGLIAKVTRIEEYKEICFEYIGLIKNGMIDTSEDNPYSHGVEEYYFQPQGEGTNLSIKVDVSEEHKEFMSELWQKALEKLKENSESNEDKKYITPIKIKVNVNSDSVKAWDYFVTPGHIEKWSRASDDWGCKDSQVDLSIGGRFSSYMYALDGSYGFEFSGIYTEIVPYKLLKYTLDDGRKVLVFFESSDDGKTVTIEQYFEPETENSTQAQREGWQSFLDNYKKYVENK